MARAREIHPPQSATGLPPTSGSATSPSTSVSPWLPGALAGLVLLPVVDGQSVTPIWPPVGLAVAITYLGGFRLLPGIVLGSFAINYPGTLFAPPSLPSRRSSSRCWSSASCAR